MLTRHLNWIASGLVLTTLALTGCAPEAPREEANSGEEVYTSPVVQGQANAINLEEVEKAFWNSKGADFNSWMTAFETRVNEIYEGEGIVSIDARRQQDRLVVKGFIDKNEQTGLQAGEATLFTVEQTGKAANNEVPYRVADGQGQVYHEGNQSLMSNPFLQAFLMAGMIGWVGSYFTPRPRIALLSNHRSAYRATPNYQRQVATNRDFRTRFAQRTGGGVTSNSRFNRRNTTAQQKPGTQPRRTWNTGGSQSRDAWGGRRAGGGGAAPRRSWGGRRR